MARMFVACKLNGCIKTQNTFVSIVAVVQNQTRSLALRLKPTILEIMGKIKWHHWKSTWIVFPRNPPVPLADYLTTHT